MPRISENDDDAYKWAEAEARKLAIKKKREALGLTDDDDTKVSASPDEAEIVRLLVGQIDWDEARERVKKAKYIINVKTKPDPDKRVTLQMWLPSLDPRDFDAEIRIRNLTGQIEPLGSSACTVEFISADAARSRAHRNMVDSADDFKRVRSELFNLWVIGELRKGRTEGLDFTTFMTESGFLKPKPSGEPPMPEPSTDD